MFGTHHLSKHKHLIGAANLQLMQTQWSFPTLFTPTPVGVYVNQYRQFWGGIPYAAEHSKSHNQQDSRDMMEKFCNFNANIFSCTI
jgi:hypothetical protein